MCTKDDVHVRNKCHCEWVFSPVDEISFESLVPQTDHGKHLDQRFTNKIVMPQIETLQKEIPKSKKILAAM